MRSELGLGKMIRAYNVHAIIVFFVMLFCACSVPESQILDPSASATPSTPGPSLSPSFAPSPENTINQIVSMISTARINQYVAVLSGEVPIEVGGMTVTLSTRNTNAGPQLSYAQQYAYDELASLGLTVTYQDWSGTGIPNRRNVIAEISGSVSPDNIVIVCANLDDMPSFGSAPGADDNASGCSALFECARALSGQSFEKTIRFILFSGEAQGLYGSSFYVNSLGAQEIVDGVLCARMIGYDSDSDPTMQIHTRTPSNTGYAFDKVISDAFILAKTECGINVVPVIVPDGLYGSSQSPFWQKGIPAIFLIEDSHDFNPYYQTTNDRVGALNMEYLTNIVKALTATVFRLAIKI